MIRIIVLYFVVGLLMVTRYVWDKVVWYREEKHLTIPLLVVAVIIVCFVTPILLVVRLIQALINSFRNN